VKKAPAVTVRLSLAEEVQLAAWTADVVLLGIESVICTSIAVWFGSATKSDIRRLQRTVQTAERIVGAPLPTL